LPNVITSATSGACSKSTKVATNKGLVVVPGIAPRARLGYLGRLHLPRKERVKNIG
jgi:hypothetical protein